MFKPLPNSLQDLLEFMSYQAEGIFRVRGNCLEKLGINDNDLVCVCFHRYPRPPAFKAEGAEANRHDVCLCFGTYPGKQHPSIMLKAYHGRLFGQDIVSTFYKDTPNVSFNPYAIFGVVYAVMDGTTRDIKWQSHYTNYPTKLPEQDTYHIEGVAFDGMVRLK